MKAFNTTHIFRRVGVLAPMAAALALAAAPSMASQLIYTPVNPSFGGNPLNGTYLLSKAQAENNHQAPLPDVGGLLGNMGLNPDLANTGDLQTATGTTITVQNPPIGQPVTTQIGSSQK
ncbi:MAG TPA: curli assembly protein CsgF [Burkholderiaceae bacterium]|nr:curli assembly protein CsgF [Burkholderiaceae bacterium]